MTDIFISYKREDQPVARSFAEALEKEGWSVWWDPKLRAGEHFDDVIEKVLKGAKCVVVIWSERSVNSRYVKDEATYALEHKKLVPVAIEAVDVPFRFRGVHTLSLFDWDGSKHASEFRSLVEDIRAIVGPPLAEARRKVDEEKETNRAGEVFRDRLKIGQEGPDMVVIPAGSFKMGDLHGQGLAAELPVHTVRFAKPFALGRFEVTFDEYDAFAKLTCRRLPQDGGWGRGRRPVINVSWEDAQAYVAWLSVQTGKRYRLPTEAEWEYAARSGGKDELWAGTNRKEELEEYAWLEVNSGGKTQEVGTRKDNQLGLHDMSGNAWEWVEDCWHDNYDRAPFDGRAWKEENGGGCGRRVVRGGSWYDGPMGLRTSARARGLAGVRDRGIGFRLVQDID